MTNTATLLIPDTVLHLAGCVDNDAGSGKFLWNTNRDQVEQHRKHWLSLPNADVTEMKTVTPAELGLTAEQITAEQITDALDADEERWTPRYGENNRSVR